LVAVFGGQCRQNCSCYGFLAEQLSAHLSCADKLREQPEVFGFIPDPTRDNCRMNFEPLRQLHDRKRSCYGFLAEQLSAHLSCADKLREQPEVFGFIPDPTRDNCRMNFEPLRQLHDRKR
jgi:hypothetical protein